MDSMEYCLLKFKNDIANQFAPNVFHNNVLIRVFYYLLEKRINTRILFLMTTYRRVLQDRTGLPNRPEKFRLTGSHYQQGVSLFEGAVGPSSPTPQEREKKVRKKENSMDPCNNFSKKKERKKRKNKEGNYEKRQISTCKGLFFTNLSIVRWH